MDPNQNGGFYNFMSNSQSPTNPNFQNPPFNSNSQNNFGNFPFCRPPYPYQFPMFQPPPANPMLDQPPTTNPILDQGTSMSIGIEQETTADLDPENQTPSFSTQVVLDNIVLDDEEEHTTQRKSRERWSSEEDKIVIQSWLSISKTE
jgi:hypothetical protein